MYHCQVIFNKITVYYQTMWRKFLDRIASWHKSDFSIKHKGTNINCIFVLNCGTQFSFLVLIAHFINFLCSALKFVAHNEIPLMILPGFNFSWLHFLHIDYIDISKLSCRLVGVQQNNASNEYDCFDHKNIQMSGIISILQFPLVQFPSFYFISIDFQAKVF